jgi:cytochrome P450
MGVLVELLLIIPINIAKALLFCLILKFVDLFRSWIVSPLNALPGPRSKSFLWGSFPSIRGEAFMEPHKRWWKQAGVDAKLLHYTTFFGRSSVVVLDKDIVREILTAPAGGKNPRFEKRLDIVQQVLGLGLVTLEGEDWMRHRRIIQPSFSSSFLKQILNDIVPSKANLLVNYWKKALGREIDVASHMSAITLDIIGHAAFSHAFHGMDEIAKWAQDEGSDELAELQDPFISAVIHGLKPNLMTIVLSALSLSFLNNTINPQARKSSRLVNDAVSKVVENAKAQNLGNAKSLLQLLLDAEDPETTGTRKLSHAELIDETKTFLVAGHETTATWCYWALYALSTHPDIQDKVFSDIEKFSTKDSDTITLEMVDEMEYFHSFLLEVLRLYAPVGLIVRTNVKSEVLGGHSIPEYTRFVIPIHLLHRHPHYWDEPEVFQPDRWETMDEDRVRFAFLPFSAGGRNCIGQRFATIEAKLILAPLVRNFRFQVSPSQRDANFSFTNIITMKSKPALKIVAQSRK